MNLRGLRLPRTESIRWCRMRACNDNCVFVTNLISLSCHLVELVDLWDICILNSVSGLFFRRVPNRKLNAT